MFNTVTYACTLTHKDPQESGFNQPPRHVPHPAVGNMLGTAFRKQQSEPLRSIRNRNSQSLSSIPENKTLMYLREGPSPEQGQILPVERSCLNFYF